MSWATAITDLRTLISDGEADKLRHRKKIFGIQDGSNVTFKTIEFRRVTDFSSATAPLGVYVDNALSVVASDDLPTGEFNLSSAPDNSSLVEATYYIQWFTDAEISVFLLSSAQWLLQASADQTPDGLKPAALHYAAQMAYQKLSLKWSEMLTETYRLEDNPKEGSFNIVSSYQKAAMDMHKKATDLRDGYYKRSGQNLQPLSGSLVGRVSDPVPRR